VKVLLSGMGADELFGGYRKHLACMLALPPPACVLRHRLAPAVERKRCGRPPSLPGGAPGQTVRRLREPASRRRRPPQLHPLRRRRVHELLTRCSTRSTSWSRSTRPSHEARRRPGEPDVLHRHALFLTGLNPAYTDRASMAASTESSPVCGQDAAAAARHPGRAKIVGRSARRSSRRPRRCPGRSYRPKGLTRAAAA
jgi:asparagine synthase (glutamine-hydrolysing)